MAGDKMITGLAAFVVICLLLLFVNDIQKQVRLEQHICINNMMCPHPLSVEWVRGECVCTAHPSRKQ